jgi:hypothetical protein
MLDYMHAHTDTHYVILIVLLLPVGIVVSLYAVFRNWRGVVEEEAVFQLVKCSDFVLQNMDGWMDG